MTRFEGRRLTCLRGERLVFSGVDFVLGAGDALLVTGPNGSGKSSLLRVMAGLLAPLAGAVLWNGRPPGVDAEAFAAALHYLGHLDAVKPQLTVAENIGFWARLRSSPPEGAAAGLVAFGIGDLADLPARLLSAGQRRRLALGRLVAAPAPLWILDEPTVALDPSGVGAVEAVISRHRAGGGIVVVSTNAPLALPGATGLDVSAYGAEHTPWTGEAQGSGL